MSEQDPASRTHDATERRLQKAREDGDTWSSREAGHLMGYGALLILASLVLPLLLGPTTASLGQIFAAAGELPLDEPGVLGRVVATVLKPLLMLLAPLFAVMLGLACLSVLASGPLVVASKRLQPKLSKLNPLAGARRIFGPQNLVEFLKNLLKLVIFGAIFFYACSGALSVLLPGAILLPEQLLGHAGQAAARGLAFVCAAMLPIVLFDIFWKRFQWLKKLKMSGEEVKREMKDSEGDPHVRARRQEIRRARLRRPVARAVPQATLVVMNPTHFAVALRYQRGVDQAPVCVAKGQDALALRIRDLAHDHDVPVIESPPLARALHAVAEIDAPIPEAHWAAVAELVGYVLDLRRRVRRKLPEGAQLLQPEPPPPARKTRPPSL